MGVSDFGCGVSIAEKYRSLAEKKMFDGNAQASTTGHTRRSPPSGITPLAGFKHPSFPLRPRRSPPRPFPLISSLLLVLTFMDLGLDQSEMTGSRPQTLGYFAYFAFSFGSG